MAKKIKRTTLVTKDELIVKEETGHLPQKHKHRGKSNDYTPVDIDEYKKKAELRNKLKKFNKLLKDFF